MEDKVQEFIAKKKRQKLRKKLTIICLLLMGIVLGVMFKARFFNIGAVLVSGNTVLSKKKIIDEKNIIGQNIFLFDQKKLEGMILTNPYIKGVTIKKQFPDKLDIKIEERKMLYKIKEGNKYYLLNKSLVLMEVKEDVSGLSLIELKGIKLEDKTIGKAVTKDINKVKVAEILGDNNILNKDISIDSLEINSINNILLNKGKIKIILGNIENLEENYKKAVNILNSKAINMESGYIDVSFKGNPVIKEDKVEKEQEDNNKIN